MFTNAICGPPACVSSAASQPGNTESPAASPTMLPLAPVSAIPSGLPVSSASSTACWIDHPAPCPVGCHWFEFEYVQYCSTFSGFASHAASSGDWL